MLTETPKMRAVIHRVEKSREENIYNVHSKEMHDEDVFFESVWKLYPVKKGKGQVSKTKKKVLQRIGYEQIKRCVERFVSDMESERRDSKYWMHGSTFFNSGYVDYLDENCNVQQCQEEIAEVEETDEELVGDDWWK